MDRYAHFAMVAAREALDDARLPDDPTYGTAPAPSSQAASAASSRSKRRRSRRAERALGPHLALLRSDADGQRRLRPHFDGVRTARARCSRSPAPARAPTTRSSTAYDKIVLRRRRSRWSPAAARRRFRTGDRRLLLDEGDVDPQRRPAARLAALRQRARRLRAGRGRRHPGARGPRLRDERAARKSTARSSATANPPTPTTSRSPTRMRAA